MTDDELTKKVYGIFNVFIAALKKYEEKFREDLKMDLDKSLKKDGYTMQDNFYKEFPKFLYEIIKVGFGNDFSDTNLVNIIKNSSILNEKVLVANGEGSEKLSVEEYIKVTSGKAFEDMNFKQRVNLGFAFEALGGLFLQNMKDYKKEKWPEDKIKVTTVIKPPDLTGFERYKGDARIILDSILDIFPKETKKIDYYIEFKWSDDLSQAIKKTRGNFTSGDSTIALADEICTELINKLREGVAHNPLSDEAIDYNIEDINRNTINSNLYLIPKRLIFLFKSGGFWSSEVYTKLKFRVAKNAVDIYRDNSKLKEQVTKDKKLRKTKEYLWYGNK